MREYDRPLAMVTGVGPGNGMAIARRLSQGGYRVAMLARDVARLEQAESDIPHTVAYPCDVTDRTALEDIIGQFGAPTVVVHNAVAAAFAGPLEADPDVMRSNFEVNTMALLHLAQLTGPAMIKAGSGAIVVTGNTSAQRGKPFFSTFAPTKAAQRIFAEALARDLGPKGVHVSYLIIDAVVDGRMRERFSDKPDDFFCSPASVADEVFHLAHQPRDAWSFLAEIRPHAENW